uniref:Transformation/transcription domain-associated protein n=1 Tax=Timema genevievae TaxID=629358 RepID=A0A7R9PHH2_TIMGE|nr:unnamed protein product [Timema genevievae]
MAPPPMSSLLPDPIAHINTFCSYVTMLADLGSKDEIKLRAAQELSENFEASALVPFPLIVKCSKLGHRYINRFGSQIARNQVILSSSEYPTFLDHSMKKFLKILQDGEPLFIGEYNIQQVRKLILEMIHRFPSNDHLRPYVKHILTLMLKLLETDNEENALVCLRIINELHRHFRPTFNPEIQHFLNFVKTIYRELPNHLSNIFEPRPNYRVADLSEINVEQILTKIYSITPIYTDQTTTNGAAIHYNMIPRAVNSMKVLQELPIIVVLMYTLYKQNVHNDVMEFIPLVMTTITLQPSVAHRENPLFCKEVFVDFMGAQIKTLSFLAYLNRIYKEAVAKHATLLVKGMLGMFTLCPQEVAHLRKELLIAARHILATDLRTKFVPFMDRLFDENILLGNGWTTNESLRPLAYSTLADLMHHARQLLPMSDLTKAIHLFSRNVHDESLPTSIQTMSCKVLIKLVECICQKSEVVDQGRELLLKMLEVFVLKFKTIAKLQLPVLIAKCNAVETPTAAAAAAPTTPVTTGELTSMCTTTTTTTNTSSATTTTTLTNPTSTPNPTSETTTSAPPPVVDAHATGDCVSCKTNSESNSSVKSFHPKETAIFIRLVKWAMRALDVYSLSSTSVGQKMAGNPNVRTEDEEKEVLELFSGVFTMLDHQTLHELFSTTVEYLVERIHQNPNLQIVSNSLMACQNTSPIFGMVLLEYLLKHMSEMGGSVERSNLYLRLFKLVFGSVSLLPQKNEHMLKPHLHQIVNRSMELAMSAKDPYNYFLLLRALFRSIGGLNNLQSGPHKQHMKDLFVELCLTVPVRLSSLLRYLSLLMDPLVSALNGSHTLISQGLRTLELCVDNLQPDFLYECIQPVRADLMQALWRTLRNPSDQIAHVAFRVLGKFGGGNRKMMLEPQKLEYNTYNTPPAILVHFIDHNKPVCLSVDKIIDTAFTALKTSTTDPFYRRHCWEIIRCYLVASLHLDDDAMSFKKLFSHPSFTDPSCKISPMQGIPYKSTDKQARATIQTAITGMFVASAIKELRQDVLPYMVFMVTHYTMVAISQQAGESSYNTLNTTSALAGYTTEVGKVRPAPELALSLSSFGREKQVGKCTHSPFALAAKQSQPEGMDPLVLIDSLAAIIGHEEKELVKPCHLALMLLEQTCANVLGSLHRACQLPLMEYMAERMCSLCYERAWYSKMGGCYAIKFMFEKLDRCWVFEHLFSFLKALLFVMMDLTGELANAPVVLSQTTEDGEIEVSSGAIELAKSHLERMLTLCAAPVEKDGTNDELVNAQKKSLFEVTHELVRQVTSPNSIVREQAMHSLQVLSKIENRSVTQVMEPHKEILEKYVPPKKHLLQHQPANAQIGIMDGNTFCTTLEPRLFTIDMTIMEHKVFFHELMSLCEAEDTILFKLPCYKSVSSMVSLRQSALRALAACHYLDTHRDKIFPVLFKALEKSVPELQETGYECMKKFIAGCHLDEQVVSMAMRPLLEKLEDHRNLTLNSAKRLSYLTQLFPTSFQEKLCDQLIQHLEKLVETTAQATTKNTENEQKLATVIQMFHQLPCASQKYISLLCNLVLQAERGLLVEASSPFRAPLLQFLLRYPQETIDLLLQDHNIANRQWSRFLEYLIKHEKGKPFRDVLQNSCSKLKEMVTNVTNFQTGERAELQYQSIRITSLLIKFNEQWLATEHDLVNAYSLLWCNDKYQELHKKVDAVEVLHWKEPKLLFLRVFLEHTVAENYTVEWKRSAFFRFLDHYPDPNVSNELKASILQLVIIPCFSISFERGEEEKLVGGPAAPEQDNPNNIVCVFIKVEGERRGNGLTSDQRNKLRSLMAFAWPCLLGKNCVDPSSRYHGHLLLSHIIIRFAIHKKIVLQGFTTPVVVAVFRSLLKAHAVEARAVVKQALEILTPSLPLRMEDGYTMLTHWTKKIIVEEGHSMQQLFHILQLIVRHYKVYYPVRHHLVQNMVNSIQRMGFSPSAALDHRRLAVDLAEVIIKWELQRIKDEAEAAETRSGTPTPSGAVKRPLCSEEIAAIVEGARKRHAVITGTMLAPAVISKLDPLISKPIERIHADAILNILMRLACQVNDANTTVGSPGEQLSRRCVTLLKMALKPEVWPQQCDLKLNWLEKVFASIDSESPNYGNICTALELLTYLLGIIKKEHILAGFKPLQRGLSACITSSNLKVLRLVHGLLSRLMTIFPTEPTTSNVASKYEELENLYASVGKVVFEGLANYEKNQQASPSSLYGTLMMLKAACVNNQSYIDRLITPFMRVLQRMTKEHLSNHTATKNNPMACELLILSLDLVKNRVVVMGAEIRKTFIGTILVGLIEKSTDIRIMKAIAKMLEDWMKNKNPIALNQAPSLREKSILLVKMMQNVEKRFSDNIEVSKLTPSMDKRLSEHRELNAQFLEVVNFIYRDETLKHSELTVKLEPAFMAGLRCIQPTIRAKFFEVFDASMKQRLQDRLLYICCSQNWESIGPHYWIKQCIELLLVTSEQNAPIKMANKSNVLPGISFLLNKADVFEKDLLYQYPLNTGLKQEQPDPSDATLETAESPDKEVQDVLDLELQTEGCKLEGPRRLPRSRKDAFNVIIKQQANFMEKLEGLHTSNFLLATTQLCHMDTALAESVWLDLFPKMWSIMSEKQQSFLLSEIVPFVCSGSHVVQKDCHPSALSTFIDALSHCQPPIAIKPILMKYLGKSHNLWHRITLSLEHLAFENGNNGQLKTKRDVSDCYDFEPTMSPQQV